MSSDQLLLTDYPSYKSTIRLVPKCTKHGVLCNESTGNCKKCDDELA